MAAGWRGGAESARRLLAALILLAGTARGGTPAGAGETLPAPEAAALAARKAVILVDVRTPVEWNDTGIPAGARTVSWGRPDFAERLLEVAGGDRNAPLVLICRTGNRSGKALAALRDNGFTQTRHVPEGMVGSAAGPGWLARGLPVEDWSGDRR